MRDRHAWSKPLRDDLKDRLRDANIAPHAFCATELGLHLLHTTMPQAPARALWALLIGFPFPGLPESGDDARAIAVARMLLPEFRSPHAWAHALEQYRDLPEIVRGFDVDDGDGPVRRRAPSIASQRWEVYDRALRAAPLHRSDRIEMATAGRFFVVDAHSIRREATLTPDLIPSSPHNDAPRAFSLDPPERTPITVAWDDLRATAEWMDARERELQACNPAIRPGRWRQRLDRVRLELFDATQGVFRSSDALTLDGVVHLVGLVGVGKSTLMDVLAVWMAQRGKRTVLVVGDVISALDRADRFARLGVTAAPLLGVTTRTEHLRKLHRAFAPPSPDAPLDPRAQDHRGFAWLSAACPLEALFDQPLGLSRPPCHALHPVGDDRAAPSGCPLHPICPRHQAQRDLIHARIWIATPASLVMTRLDPLMQRESLRFAELAARCSDLIIVDEADRVQLHLDLLFSPSDTLIASNRDAWLNWLHQRTSDSLSDSGRGVLRDRATERWLAAHEKAQIAANRLYALLQRNRALRDWIVARDFFTDYTLFWSLARDLADAAEDGADVAERIMTEANRFIHQMDEQIERLAPSDAAAPADGSAAALADLTRRALFDDDDRQARAAARRWIDAQCAGAPGVDERVRAAGTDRLIAAVLTAALQNRMHRLLTTWRDVESSLALDRDPPQTHAALREYSGVVPTSPLGAALAFHLAPSGDERARPDELRFVRWIGVGRWMLIRFPSLFAADGFQGPPTLLLSATSWAGDAPITVQVPVTGALRGTDAATAAIAASAFEFRPQVDTTRRDRPPITVSGAEPNERPQRLEALLRELTRQPDGSRASVLERLRDDLDPSRRRLLLLVGSYCEAHAAADGLRRLRPDWRDQVMALARDDAAQRDDPAAHAWRSAGAARTLPRGQVAQFAQSDAWILVAPLLAVERGHNIVADDGTAAIGAVLFLVRPHPRPDDLAPAIHAVNRWTVQRIDEERAAASVSGSPPSVDAIAGRLRRQAFAVWRDAVQPKRYADLTDEERSAFTWTMIASIWQVIGRTVRGGVPTRVIFCDAAFAPNSAWKRDEPDAPQTSLLASMRHIARRMLSDDPSIPIADRALARELYEPLFAALVRMTGVHDEP